MRVLFATSEFAPLVSVGGLAEAASGLVHALRAEGVDVTLVVPDYFGSELDGEVVSAVAVPEWAGPARARSGSIPGVGPITLIDVPGIRKPNPYVDANGRGWPDNPERFFAFSAAVAAMVRADPPDVLHCNDWHTGPVLGLLEVDVPSVVTLHTIAYQGWTSGGWLDRLSRGRALFEAYGGTNPLAGAIHLADRVVAVSEHYAHEITTAEGGFGLDGILRGLGDRLVGIRNGIDVDVWNPEKDPEIPAAFSAAALDGKDVCRMALLEDLGWEDTRTPVVAMVTRLVDQKGIDLALGAIAFADGIPFRLAVLGSGERWMADWARHEAAERPDVVWFHDGFDRSLAHRMFAGADLLLMPSRFEPCGLAQMQAMTYGTIPVVTSVGGLVDTVADADASRKGTGFRTLSTSTEGVVDAMHRASRAWRQPARRRAIQRRGMQTDWSWATPAAEHIALYQDMISEGPISRS